MPNLAGFLVFTAGPVLYSLAVSFTNWNLQHTVPMRWIGPANYIKMFQEQEFWVCFANTIYLMLGMPVAIAGSLALALALHRRAWGGMFWRSLYYLPSITCGVALMILWKILFNPEMGPLNAILNWLLDHFGINALLSGMGHGPVSPPNWLQSTYNLLGLDIEQLALTTRQWGLGARDAIIIMGIWVAIGGNNMILYLAALSNISPDLYEAAAIDGAGGWKLFRHVTWPQLAPTTFFIVVMSFIGGLQGGFEQARVMTAGGPSGTTTTLTYYIYQKAFEEFQMGYASAVSWILFLMIFGVTLMNWKFGSKELNY